ncbi:PLAC8-like protein 1 [Saccostrea echinata]|uniref:PLAC8-like protein 1 n=1 Tax=Saccostrea echinata TaxID=191078 RepID=UPI002A83DC8E|nr:PLAC8-like protein 1 [Saccostrea echinata]
MTTNVVVVQQPMAVNNNSLMVTGINGHREWTTGLCECDDKRKCLVGCCCVLCSLCSLARRTGECPLMAYYVLGGLTLLRSRIRTIGGIKGTVSNDNMIMKWCCPCGVLQMERELENMGIP